MEPDSIEAVAEQLRRELYALGDHGRHLVKLLDTVQDALENAQSGEFRVEASLRVAEGRVRALESQLKSASVDLREASAALETRAQASRAVRWRPDTSRDACAACAHDFTIFNRRHHCRQCGDIFDAACCNNFSSVGESVLRSCDTCFGVAPRAPVETSSNPQSTIPVPPPLPPPAALLVFAAPPLRTPTARRARPLPNVGGKENNGITDASAIKNALFGLKKTNARAMAARPIEQRSELLASIKKRREAIAGMASPGDLDERFRRKRELNSRKEEQRVIGRMFPDKLKARVQELDVSVTSCWSDATDFL